MPISIVHDAAKRQKGHPGYLCNVIRSDAAHSQRADFALGGKKPALHKYPASTRIIIGHTLLKAGKESSTVISTCQHRTRKPEALIDESPATHSSTPVQAHPCIGMD